MVKTTNNKDEPVGHWRARMDLTAIVAVSALVISGLSFYRSYLYTKQQLDVTVTEVSYVTDEGGLYITVAFANAGNRDAALLRVEPALWSRGGQSAPEWVPLVEKVRPNIPLTVPRTPTVVKTGGVEIVTLSTRLDAADAEPAIHQTLSGFADLQSAPPGDRLQSNKKTPFVWAEEHY